MSVNHWSMMDFTTGESENDKFSSNAGLLSDVKRSERCDGKPFPVVSMLASLLLQMTVRNSWKLVFTSELSSTSLSLFPCKDLFSSVGEDKTGMAYQLR